MCNSEAGNVEDSKELSKLFIEVEFLSQTIDTLMDMAKEQAEAITSIVNYLNEKKEE